MDFSHLFLKHNLSEISSTFIQVILLSPVIIHVAFPWTFFFRFIILVSNKEQRQTSSFPKIFRDKICDFYVAAERQKMCPYVFMQT